MSTPAGMVQSVRRKARDYGLGTITLDGALDASQTDVALVDAPAALEEGQYIEFDLEVMEVTTAAETSTVRRGQMATTATTHTDGTLGVIEPRYTSTAIIDALNESLHVLNGQYPREVWVTDSSLEVATLTESYSMPTKPTGEGEYLDIKKVQIETLNDGLYRNHPMWLQEDHRPPTLVLRGGVPTGRAIRVLATQEYEVMAYGDTARPVGLTDDLEAFLIRHAAGLLLEYDDVYAADFKKQDVEVGSDFRGTMQRIGRNLQYGAIEYLGRIKPASRMVTIGSSRTHRG